MDSRPRALLVPRALPSAKTQPIALLLQIEVFSMRPIHLSGALSCLMFLAACGKQAEGERCDLNSGNLDCDTGLVCRSGDQASIVSGRGVALCCPPEGVTPSVNACRAGGAELPPEVRPDAGPGDGGA
jgi:hypothetical protein